MKRRFIFFLGSLFFYFSICAQQNTPEIAYLKTAMIFKIIDNVTWSNQEQIDTFRIGIFGIDSAMYFSLINTYQGKRIKNKPVEIVQFSRISEIEKSDIQILYVSPARTPTVDRLSRHLVGEKILLVTDASNSLYTMVNLFMINDKSEVLLQFEVFRANMEKEGFKISEEMLIYGGSRKDIQEIIAQTKSELDHIQKTLIQKQEILRQKEQETFVQIAELERQKEVIALHRVEMNHQDEVIEKQLKKVKEQEEYIQKQKENLKLLAKEVEKQHNLLGEKIKNLQEQEEIIREREERMSHQTSVLINQQKEIKTKQNLIESQEQTLLGHADKIALQKRFLYVMVIFSIFIVFLVIIAFRAYQASKRQTDILFKKNKEIRDQNQEINYQKRVLLEKTEELNLTNFTLLERQEEIQQQTDKLIEQSLKLKMAFEQAELEKKRAEEAFKELENTQTQLISAEKLASLGQVAAGVAHEVNTPLGAIKASIGTMLEQQESIFTNLIKVSKLLSDREAVLFFKMVKTSVQIHEFHTSKEERKYKRKLVEYLEDELQLENADVLADNLVDMGFLKSEELEPFMLLLKHKNVLLLVQSAYEFTSFNRDGQNILVAVNKAAKVIYALKSYARVNTSHEMQTVFLEENINTVLILYYNQIKQGIELNLKIDKNIKVTCFPDELNQVWTNLIHNAIQAMNNKGVLTIQAEQQQEFICVKIHDTGCGIPKEIQEKIFEPFFTTKAIGEGSGLGLDIVRQILKHHNGNISVESEVGNTTFTICLPLEMTINN